MITFILVAILRKENDSENEEFDPNDDGCPIYVDELLGDLNNLKELEVMIFFKLKITIYLGIQIINFLL